jgi:glycosidase
MDQHTGKETSTKTRSSLSWWQRVVIYQIAPLSFQDSNGDGKGDLNGILQRIDYLAWVGVDAVWLCPIYPSPMLDFGYDIADFCAVGAQFGSIADFDCLLDGQERIAAMLAFTLPGTAFCFAGDELGMRGVKIPSDRINDESEKRVPEYGLNRDPERAPMRWDSGPKAGFTTGEPWLPLGADVAECNVARLQQNQQSILWLYRRLLELRHKHAALTAGEYHPLRSVNQILRFERVREKSELLIALNMSSGPGRLEIRNTNQILLSTYLDRDGCCETSIMLRANEGLILGSSP